MATSQLLDTIAAIATPVGRSALAVIRVSGNDAIDILLALVPDLSRSAVRERSPQLVPLIHPETAELLDRALVTAFIGPRSYTGEDLLEISCHGGMLTPQLVLGAVYAAGARPALPGEFTRRAYLNGKIDLVQAEAIADVIDGRSPAIHRAAVHQMERGLSRRLDELREAILRAEASAAYAIDFPEEDEPPVPPARIVEAVRDVNRRIGRMLASAPEGELLREGALVVLAGYPNSGKSSLFNALVGTERAIVTELPGTTRDAIEAEIVIRGFPFRLADTAGIRDTDDRVETLGIEVARRYLARADVVLMCSEADGPLSREEEEFLAGLGAERTVLVRTKADLHAAAAGGEAAAAAGVASVRVSALAGTGLDRLRELLLERAFTQLREVPEDAPIITRERHARALRAAEGELSAFEAAVASDLPIDIAATHLRAAAGAIEDIVGVVTPDDVLGAVFSQFCVGK